MDKNIEAKIDEVIVKIWNMAKGDKNDEPCVRTATLEWAQEELRQLFEPKPSESRLLAEKKTKLAIGHIIKDFGCDLASAILHNKERPDIIKIVEEVYAKTASIKDQECQQRVEGIKRELRVIIKGEFSKASDIQVCLKSLLDAWKEEGI